MKSGRIEFLIQAVVRLIVITICSAHLYALPVSGRGVIPCDDVKAMGIVNKGNAEPRVVPSLRQWMGGNGRWVLTKRSRIVVESAQSRVLMPIASQFASDLASISGFRLPIIKGETVKQHDVAFSLSVCTKSTADIVGGEGYTLGIKDSAVLRANTATGLFYAGRTFLQILTLQTGKGAGRSLPQGNVLDYPRFHVRSILLDVGRTFMSKGFIEDYIRFMSWYKLNTLVLHLNDQAFGLNRDKNAIDAGSPAYYSRALRLLSDKFPGLRPTDGDRTASTSEALKGYSHADWDEMEDVAATYRVEIKPEIDTPSHAGIFLTDRPDLTLVGAPPQWGGTLDLNNPTSLTYMKSVFDEFLPWFRSPNISIGGDEASPEQTGLSVEKRTKYLDDLMTHILVEGAQRGKRRSISVWNDAYDPQMDISRYKDTIVIQNWLANDDEYISHYGVKHVINSSAKWYVIPKRGMGQNARLAHSIYDKWTASPHVIGGQICEWGDNAALGLNEEMINDALKDVMPAAAQTFWSGRLEDANGGLVPYDVVAEGLPVLSYGPGVTELKGALMKPMVDTESK